MNAERHGSEGRQHQSRLRLHPLQGRGIDRGGDMLEQDSREDAGFVLLLAAAMLLPEPARWSSAVPLAFSLARVSDEAQPRPQTGTAH